MHLAPQVDADPTQQREDAPPRLYDATSERMWKRFTSMADSDGVGQNRLQFTIRKSTSRALTPGAAPHGAQLVQAQTRVAPQARDPGQQRCADSASARRMRRPAQQAAAGQCTAGGPPTGALQDLFHSAEEDHARLLPGHAHVDDGRLVVQAHGQVGLLAQAVALRDALLELQGALREALQAAALPELRLGALLGVGGPGAGTPACGRDERAGLAGARTCAWREPFMKRSSLTLRCSGGLKQAKSSR